MNFKILNQGYKFNYYDSFWLKMYTKIDANMQKPED